MEALVQEIGRLQNALNSYNRFLVVLYGIIFIVVLALISFAVMFIKSRRSLRNSNTYLRYTIKGQEEERARIARELHDTIAQDLRYCRSLSEKFQSDDGKQLSELLEKTLLNVRNMSYNLAPPDVIKNDLTANVLNLAQNFREHSSVEFRLTFPDQLESAFLSEEQNLNLYRIIQEALSNVIKHAGASEVTLLVRNENGDEPKGIYIFICDDGKGFDPQQVSARSTDGKHFGIVGMTERAELIGAKLEIDSHEGEGTQITVIAIDPRGI